MKIAVFATGWNGEYLRDMYHGLENSQKEFQFQFLQMMNLYHLLCHIRLSWGIK